MYPPNYNQIPMPNGQKPQARVMTQQPEAFSGPPSVAAAEAARQQQAAAEAQARESERRFMALLQQTVDNRLSGLGTFLDQTRERVESLERGLAETMAFVQTIQPGSGSPLTQNEHRVLLLVQSGVMTRDEARAQLGLGKPPVVIDLLEKRKPGRPRKEAVPAVEADVLKELGTPEA